MFQFVHSFRASAYAFVVSESCHNFGVLPTLLSVLPEHKTTCDYPIASVYYINYGTLFPVVPA